MSQQNVASAKHSYEALNRGDMMAAFEDFELDALWVEPAGSRLIGGEHHVPQEVLSKVFAQIGQNWQEFSVQTSEFLEAGDRVIVLGNYSGKGKGQDQEVTIPFVHVITYNNGKIVNTKNFTDTAVWNEVMVS